MRPGNTPPADAWKRHALTVRKLQDSDLSALLELLAKITGRDPDDLLAEITDDVLARIHPDRFPDLTKTINCQPPHKTSKPR